jgi:NAD(P)H-hydrate epimerase
MKVVTSAQMAEIDRVSVADYGFGSGILMENAGIKLTDAFISVCSPGLHDSITVVCGQGNNGGDGYVMARQLLNKGFTDVTVISAGDSGRASELCLANRRLAQKLGISVNTFPENESCTSWLAESDFIIDSIFGTGLNSCVRSEFFQIIEEINKSSAVVVSVDIPSGLYSGYKEGDSAVMCNHLLTVELPKSLFYQARIRPLCGAITVVPIGFPKALYADSDMELLDSDYQQKIQTLYPDFPGSFSYKNTKGHLLVCAGSTRYPGAAVLCANAAASGPCGLVSLLSDSDNTCGYDSSVILSSQNDEFSGFDAYAIGPGLDNNSDFATIAENLSNNKAVKVLDASILSAGRSVVAAFKGPKILTPHPGEFYRLTGCSREELFREPYRLVSEACREFDAVIVLKNAVTVTGTPEGRIYISDTPSAVEGVAGSGDVLTGIIGSLAAAGLSTENAALCGVMIHSRAAELAFRSEGLVSAARFIDYISLSVKDFFAVTTGRFSTSVYGGVTSAT